MAATRSDLLRRGRLLLLAGVVGFIVAFLGVRLTWQRSDALGDLDRLLAQAADLVAADADLPKELAELRRKIAVLGEGGNPFAVVADDAPIVGPDGKELSPDDPRYAIIARRRAALLRQGSSQELAALPPEQALAQVAAACAGRMHSYSVWLSGEADAAAERSGDDAEVAAKVEDQRRIAAQALTLSAELDAVLAPLGDPEAWARDTALAASLAGLCTAAVPWVVAAFLFHLGRMRGRRDYREENLPAARGRLWRQERDLQYHGFTSYGVHILLILLPFISFHCAHDLGPPGGGGGEVGEKNPEEQIQVVEVKRRKLVVNPFSPIVLDQPDELDVDVQELTKRLATASAAGGEGEGEGGYEGGAGNAFTFVAINHGGQHWDEATRTQAASKFLGYFRTRTGVKTNLRPLELSVGDLRAQRDDNQQPALIYLCLGSSPARFTRQDLAFLRRYVDEIGGVILIDAVARGARRQADDLARSLFGTAAWKTIGRDDALMNGREQLGSYADRELALSAHDGANLMGVRGADGAWCMIYHPGDLVDAWRGAYDAAWQETGFRIGVNIADYAMKRFTRRRRGGKEP